MSGVGRRLGRNLIWNSLQTWGSTALVLAGSIVYARLLQPEAWGVYSTFLWLVTSGTLLVVLGWNLTINKLVAEAAGQADPARAARIVQSTLLIQTLGALLLGGLGLTFAPNLAAWLNRPELPAAMPIIVLGVAANALAQTATMGLIALERYRSMSVVTLATSSASFVAGLLWLAQGGGPAGLIAVTAAANLVNAALTLRLLGQALPIFGRFALDRPLLAAMARYSFWSTVLLIMLQIVYERAEIFFLSRSRPAAEVGYYSLAVAMTNLAITIVPNVVIGPLLAMASELHSRGDRDGLRDLFVSSTRLLALIAPPVGVGGALVALPLLELLYGASYRPVAYAAALLLPPAALMVVAKPASSLLWGVGEQRLMLLALVPGAMLNLALDAAVIPWAGVYGAVAASTVAQTLATLASTAICLRYLGFRFPLGLLARTTGAALLMLPLGLPLLLWLHGPLLVVAQLLVGLVMYPLGLALLRALEPADLAVAQRLLWRLPVPLRDPVETMLHLIVRPPATPAAGAYPRS